MEALLAADGTQVSGVTIQKILDDAGLGKRYNRRLALEEKNFAEAIECRLNKSRF